MLYLTMKKFILLSILSISLLAKTQTIVLGAGCFWGVQKYFENLDGVIKNPPLHLEHGK